MPLIHVIHADDRLLVVDKPAGLLVHRTAEDRRATEFLVQTLRDQTGGHVHPVHRLDRATSGLILLTRRQEDVAPMQRALTADSCVKRYIALCRGRPPATMVLDRPLTDDHGVRREALTTVVRLVQLGDFAVVRAQIGTGRRHQIRRHLAHASHHVVGDTTYGKGGINRRFREDYALTRLFLHARLLAFDCPWTGARRVYHSRLPSELAECLRRLAAHA